MKAAAETTETVVNSDMPEWVYKTPEDYGYTLTMWETQSGGIQQEGIEITRAEYISLKDHLATMRGFAVSKRVMDAVFPGRKAA